MSRFMIMAATLLAAGLANAHPDHPGGSVDVAHQLTDPFHVTIGLLGVGAALILVATWRSIRKSSAFAPASQRTGERRL